MFKTSSANYYQDNKERLQNKAPERYQSLSKKKKEIMQQHGRERCKNLSENEKKSSLGTEKNIAKREKMP